MLQPILHTEATVIQLKNISQKVLLLFLNTLHCLNLTQVKSQSPYKIKAADTGPDLPYLLLPHFLWMSTSLSLFQLLSIPQQCLGPGGFELVTSSVTLSLWVALISSRPLLKCPLLREVFLITLNKRRLLPKLLIVVCKSLILFYFTPVYQ